MSNEYYVPTGSPGSGAAGSSAVIRSEFSGIEDGFDKLPTMNGASNQAIFVNSGGTALEAVNNTTARVRLALGSIATQNANNVALTGGTANNIAANNTTLTSPTINTGASVGGAWTAAATWTLPAMTLGGTITSNNRAFSGTISNLGTVTTADINGGTVDGAAIGGSSAAAGSFTTLTTTGAVLFGDTANANNASGLTVNQGGADDHVLTLKNSDVAHALTSGGVVAAETDDFLTISKAVASTGGAIIQVIGESSSTTPLQIVAHGGAPSTTDVTTSVGAILIRYAEHDGANAKVDAAANANLLTVQSYSSGAFTTRLLLKADDGELHLGNTTLVALDGEDDIGLVRAMQREASGGAGMVETPWDGQYGTPTWSYEALKRVGVLGEKDEQGNCLFRVQPRFAMNEGAIWQLYCRQQEDRAALSSLIQQQASRIAQLETKLLGLV